MKRYFMCKTGFNDNILYVELSESKRLVYLVNRGGDYIRTRAWNYSGIKKLVKRGDWFEFKIIGVR